MDKKITDKDLTKLISDKSLLRFDEMKQAYINHTKEELNMNENVSNVNENVSDVNDNDIDSYNDNAYWELAKIWVDSYSKAMSRDEEPGVQSFEGFVSIEIFNKCMQIAEHMRGKEFKDYAEQIAVVVGYGSKNAPASEAIIYFMQNPVICNMFNMECSEYAPDYADNIVQEVLDGNSKEELEALNEAYEIQHKEWIHFASVSATAEESKEEELKEEESKAEVEEKVERNMPSISVEDFSPKEMYEKYGKVDFDGENLIVIGSDGEEFVEENPDKNLVKVAMMNRIWFATCLNYAYTMAPDLYDEQMVEEIRATLFAGDNAVILDGISQILLQEKITNVDAILKRLIETKNVKYEMAFIHKAFDFLSNLAQFGDMDLDFKGVQPREVYIDLIRENSTPVLERKKSK